MPLVPQRQVPQRLVPQHLVPVPLVPQRQVPQRLVPVPLVPQRLVLPTPLLHGALVHKIHKILEEFKLGLGLPLNLPPNLPLLNASPPLGLRPVAPLPIWFYWKKKCC